MRCFQWIKDTNLKANHNEIKQTTINKPMFPMHQRYEFESKSQRPSDGVDVTTDVSNGSKILI